MIAFRFEPEIKRGSRSENPLRIAATYAHDRNSAEDGPLENRVSQFGWKLAVGSDAFCDEPNEATGPKFVSHKIVQIVLKRRIVAEILSAIGSVFHNSHRRNGIFEQPAVLVLKSEIKAF